MLTGFEMRNHCCCQTYQFHVGMTCGGCKNAVTRILSNTPGVSSFDVNVESKQVIVTGTMERAEIEERLSKWAAAGNKEVTFMQELQ